MDRDAVDRGSVDRGGAAPSPEPAQGEGGGSAPASSEARRIAPEEIGFAVRPVRPPTRDRRLSAASAFAAILVVALVLKPWASGDAGPTTRPRPVAAATTAPTAAPTPETAKGLAGPICLGAGAWRIATLETWRHQDVRVWRAIEPVRGASGPEDPTIPTAPVVAIDIPALGWCAPAYGPGEPVGPAEIDAWYIDGAGAHALLLDQVLPVRGATPYAGLYEPLAPCPLDEACPPDATRPRTQAWASGRVVFRYRDTGTNTDWWLGADVVVYEPASPGGTEPPAAEPEGQEAGSR